MASEAGSGSEAPTDARGARRSRRWMLLACVVLLVGLTTSALGALLMRSSAREHNRQSFFTSATNVSQTVQTLLRGDVWFARSLGAVLTMEPHMSATRFAQWYAQLQGQRQQAGGLGTSVVEVVPARRLRLFIARRDADPTFRALSEGRIVPVARDGRARYCLLSAVASTSGGLGPQIDRLLQGDWCDPKSPIGATMIGATSEARLLRAARDTGELLVFPFIVEGARTSVFEIAIYRHGARLNTVAQRRASLTGWLQSSFDVPAIVHRAIGRARGLSVAIYHSNPGERSELAGRVGRPLGGTFTQSRSAQIDGRWTVVVHGTTTASRLSPDMQGLLVLAGGVLISLLLFGLILVLSRSRALALRLVAQKTGQLRHQALHDSLTGLPNRVLALDRAEQMLARARRQHMPVAALYVDIDGFKQVNDSRGHAAGDELLRIVAERLASVVREGDTAARLGGNEFVVLLEGSTLDAGPELVAQRLLEVLRQPYEIGNRQGRSVTLTASIGIAAGPRRDADELLADADLALYEAKAAGKDRVVLFQAAMQDAARDRLELEMDLAQALDRDELFLCYQPIFDLRSEALVGMEALVRWRHPQRGVVEPGDFVGIAEESRLIVPIGHWVLRQACAQAGRWRRQGHDLEIAVNVSARQLEHDSVLVDVRDALHLSGLEPGALTLEVTETALMRDPVATAARLRALKQIGVRIAIDDFGTGYSSLSYLRQFPADALKIDRSFVRDMARSKQADVIIHTLVQLGKTLHVQTLAEGIEHQAQLEKLQREQCDQGQGFLFSRPLDAAAAEQFLASPGARVSQGRRAEDAQATQAAGRSNVGG